MKIALLAKAQTYLGYTNEDRYSEITNCLHSWEGDGGGGRCVEKQKLSQILCVGCGRGCGGGHNLWLVEVQPPSLPEVVELVSSSDSTSTAMLSSSSFELAASGEYALVGVDTRTDVAPSSANLDSRMDCSFFRLVLAVFSSFSFT